MPTDKQRRDVNRVRLQRQLEQRRIADERRKRRTLIVSIAGTLVLIAAVIVVVVIATSGSDKKAAAGVAKTASSTASPTASPSVSATSAAAGNCGKPVGAPVTFDGVTVTNAKQVACKPLTTSKGTADPKKLEYRDLVVGTGKAATPTSSVSVQYLGELYRKGTTFDASWNDGGKPATFSLAGGVITGFTQGIGGTTGVPAMKVGGRRIMILPASLAYKTAGSPPTIPASTALVFVVDLTSVG